MQPHQGELWRRARAGDGDARKRLIELHMPLARSLAVQYRHAREPLEDLCQVANLGLVKAVDRFDPDRFSQTRKEDQVFKRNFLAFGWGPHQCVGQRYALNHLVLFIAMFSTLLDFKRVRSDGCDEIVYCPTISPKDGCTVLLSRRVAAFPDLPLN